MATDPTPKDRASSLDLRAVVREARRWVGARLEKAYDLAPGGLSLSFRARDAGRAELEIVPGRYAAVVPAGQEHAEGISPLAREVRRVATGASLRDVRAPSGERYLELELGRASDDAPTVLGAELFGAGNLILARAGSIVAVQRARRWGRRELRVGAPYSRPPSRPDAFELGPREIELELARSRTDLASTLAARLALGGPIAEEVVARGGWEPSIAASPRARELAPEVHRALRALVEEIDAGPRGFLVRRDGVVVDATPYRSRRWDTVTGAELLERATFSEVEVELFRELAPSADSAESRERAERRQALLRQREQQAAAVDALARAVREQKAEADAILADYPLVEAALGAAEASRRSGSTVSVRLGARTVELEARTGPREAARARYEEAKRLAEKLAGAQEALQATEARLAEPELAPAAAAQPAPRARRSRAERWYEKFRWFVSSDGSLVLAGRDAASNDLLVRRHLGPGDLYLHADLHGAASVVVKRASASVPPSEATVRESAQWAVAFSKAWRAGLASATAFWANPDQVSKQAASGEFVPRGAWVVRGTKHFVPEVPLELAVGPVRYDGVDYLWVAPKEAVRARGELRFLLTPGEERDRAARESELARELGIGRSALQALLPAGGLSVRRP